MTLVALIICLLFSGLGTMGVVSPSRLLGVYRRFQTPMGLSVVAALRVVLGVALLSSASASSVPELIGIGGVIIINKGVVTPAIGVKRFRRHLDWWSAQGSGFIRGWALITLALGLSVAYAIVP